ncbi:HD domain-containing protein [Amylibacter sp. IMCC11727]|uniref:HD domain-containing protein n=1 Tax=Amylibacter sp. IMCC11727 TaxID=3039851 RepID=UPI00244DB962|nr:HD domain-containing protein [Amylibacter sp. IMCC11727]WGI21749.1 HD domain-containing protein [Amylibacter sp. IMCC11727]
MDVQEARKRLAFLERAEALKDTFRSGFTSGGRSEDTASHTWRLCLWVLVFEDQLAGLDMAKMLKMAVLHDLGEAVSGDIPATEQVGDKSADERADFIELLGDLPDPDAFLSLWDEYDGATSDEAKVIKGLDKLETILQHTQGKNPADFDYGFNLGYRREATAGHPLLKMLRAMVDEKTRGRMEAKVNKELR